MIVSQDESLGQPGMVATADLLALFRSTYGSSQRPSILNVVNKQKGENVVVLQISEKKISELQSVVWPGSTSVVPQND
jgi:hypothetical protein